MPLGMDVLGSADPNAPPVLSEQLGLPAGSAPNILNPPSAMPTLAPQPATPPTPYQNFAAKAIQSILGTRVDYKVDPATGQTVPVPMKASGSDIFRGILAGALLGAHAGQTAHNENPQGGLLQGIAAGGASAIGQNTVVDAQKRQRSQEDFKNALELRKQTNEETYRDAQIASMHISDMHAQMQMDLIPQEHIQTLNNTNDVLAEKYGSEGTVPQITVGGTNVNGKEGNVYDIQNAIQKDPQGVMKAPDGFHRVSTQHVDYSGLKYKPGTGWVDSAGKNVDMATRTTMTIFDIPNDIAKQPITMTGKEWNKLAGAPLFPNDDTQRTGSAGAAIAFKDKATKDALERAQTNRANEQAAAGAALMRRQAEALKQEITKGADRDMRADIAGIKETGTLIQQQIKNYRETLADFSAKPEDRKIAQEGLNNSLVDYNSAMATLKQVEAVHLKKQGIETVSPQTAPPIDPVQSALDFSSKYPIDQQLAMATDPATPLTPDQRSRLIQSIKARAEQAPGGAVGPQTGSASPGSAAPIGQPDQYNERHMVQ